MNNTLDIPAGERLIKKERKEGKANIVLVSFHGGAEGFAALHVPGVNEIFYGEDRGNVKEFARRMIDAGADAVLGHGPHVPRAMEIYNGHLIAYSLGNFASYKSFNLSGYNGTSLMLDLSVDRKGRFVKGKIIPLRLIEYGTPAMDKKHASADLVRLLSEEDFPETGVLVAKDGSIGKRPKAKTGKKRVLAEGAPKK
jgi:hypothetical protein